MQYFAVQLNTIILWLLQTSSVAVDDTTVYGPHSMNCFSPTPPDFEEQARNEGQCHTHYSTNIISVLL